MALKFSSIQALGRALMLPIAMLPVAGLLLRFGQADLFNVAAIANAGSAIFENLPLLFAIGVAVGFARDNNGAAGMAGTVGYLILSAMLKTINKEIDMGVFGGIMMGAVAGVLYNKYKDIRLPEFLAFFGGKRFIPIATGTLAVILGLIFAYIWPPIQQGLHLFSQWMASSGEIGLFLFGFFNRILLVTGLHHVLDSLFWFQLGDYTNSQGVVVHGDIARFMAGDPSAGYFQAGFFPIMMFGLPAICLAMYTTAHSDKRKAVAGLLLSMALTSFLTGVTEPIEYSFVFLAPVLYLIHAILTGISLALTELFHIRLGFSFSSGAIDYILFFKIAQNPLLMLPLGALMFVAYYGLGVFFIKKYNLATIGREEDTEASEAISFSVDANSRELQFIEALGGNDNLCNIDACTTRLRLIVKDSQLIDKAKLKALGAKGVVTPSPETVQVILGPQAEIVASKMREAKMVKNPTPLSNLTTTEIALDQLINGLGGMENLIRASVIALTRVKIEIRNEQLVKPQEVAAAGVVAMIEANKNCRHLYIGTQAAAVVLKLNQVIK